MDELSTRTSSTASGGPARSSLAKDTVIYGVGTVLTKVVSFLMLPVYTRVLTPADYGVLQLLQMVSDIVAIALSAGTTAGFLRFYYKTDSVQERHRLAVTAFLLLLGLNAIGSLGLLLGAGWVSRTLLAGDSSVVLVQVTAVNFVLDAFITVPLLVMQAEKKALMFMGVTLGKLILNVVLNIYFLLVLRLGVLGVLLGAFCSASLTGVLITGWMLRRAGLRPSKAALRSLRRFGLPYQFVTAGTFILTFGDRYFLREFRSLDDVGLYGLAYQFGFLLYIVSANPFLQAWSPHRFEIAHQPRAERDAAYSQGFIFLNLIMVTLGVLIAVFVQPLLLVMSAPAFHTAARFVPIILAAYIFQAWTSVAQFGIDVSERTTYATLATWISVIAILALYLALIPPYGPLGAAVATLIAFAIRFAAFYYWAQRLWPVSYQWAPVLRLAGLATVVVAGVLVVPTHNFLVQVLLGVSGSTLYGVVGWRWALDEEHRVTVWQAGQRLGARLRLIVRMIPSAGGD